MNMNQLVVHSRLRRVIHRRRGTLGRPPFSGGNSGAGTETEIAGGEAGFAGSGAAESCEAWEGESMMGGRTPEFCGGKGVDICATAQNQV
ncbi:hypothetical protein SAMD00023378_4715 [Ralstonia sp. NT80]|nr:hypothetical protein SAMD00023378_4715 [Ralstonia sp. NT80]